MIKLIAFDLDGTIIHEKYISEETKKTFKKLKENGIYLVACTGRNYNSTIGIYEELGILDKKSIAILTTGSSIENMYDRSVISGEFLYDKDYRYIKDKFKDSYITAYCDDVLYYEKHLIKEFSHDANALKTKTLKLKKDEKITKEIQRINIMGTKEELDSKYENVLNTLSHKYYVVRNIPESIEILNKNCSKESGIKRLIKILNIKKDEVLVIGDGRNDITMLSSFKNSVAMGNASDEVKTFANFVTERFEQEGFTKAMKFFKLI